MQKGSYTVEAALLMPFLIGVIMAVICMAYLVHDKVLLYNLASELALEQTEKIHDSLVPQSKKIISLSEEDLKTIEKTCMMVQVLDGEIVIQEKGRVLRDKEPQNAMGKVEVRIKAAYEGKGLFAVFLRSHMAINAEVQKDFLSPAKYVRSVASIDKGERNKNGESTAKNEKEN